MSELWKVRWMSSVLRSVSVWLLVILASYGLILLLITSDPAERSAGLREWRWTLLEPLLLIGLLLVFCRQRSARQLIAVGLLGSGVLAGLLGLIELLDGGGVMAGNVRRIDGPFPHPNALALYVLRIVVFAGVLTVLSRRLRPLAGVALVVTGLALVASLARSGMVAFAAAAALVSGWVDRWVRLAGAAVVIAGAIFLLLLAGDRLVGPSGLDSLGLRADIWESGVEMVRDQPVLGYGPDQFLYVYAPRYIEPTAWDERFTSHGHNFLLDAWVRLGIIGAAFALSSVGWVAFKVGRVLRGPDRTCPLEVAAVIALAAAVIQGMVDNGYFAHDLAMSGWLLAWLAFGSTYETPTGGT